MKNLWMIFLFSPLQLFAQNCTTQPSMNTMTINNSPTPGITGCTTCGTGGTITVNLTMPWTSQTGWATVYPSTYPSFAAPGNAGSYKILSGNGTMQLLLDASPSGPAVVPPSPIGTTPSRTNGGVTANGSSAGNYVSDLGVIRNSARNYTIVWSTPNFNSDSWISYGDDEDTVTIGAIGYKWVSQDETTGVVNHSITIDKLDTNGNLGTYGFTVWSNCFKSNGTPDVTLSAHLPQGAVVSLGPNAAIGSYGFQKIVTTTPDTQANGYPYEDIFTLQGYDGYPATFVNIPQQDKIHQGYRVSPGGTMSFPGSFIDTVAPEWPVVGDNGVLLSVNDWVATGGFFAVYGKSGSAAGAAWTGQTILVRSSGGGISINIPSNVADGRNPAACTAIAGAQVLTLDDGTPACAFPFKASATRWLNGTHVCGTTITCGPPGTPLTPISNTPFVSELWAIVFTPTPVTKGSVGPWVSQYTGAPGVPCELQININIEKPNPAYTNAGCKHYETGPVWGPNGTLFTYQGNVPAADGSGTGPWGGQEANCAWNGLRNENTFQANSQPTWFYDGAYVCHRLDLQYPKAGGANNDEYEKHILGIQMEQAGWQRANDSALFGDFKVSSAYTINNNPVCNTVYPAQNALCATMTIPVTGDLTALAAGFNAGTRYRICVNQTTAYNWGCLVFPYSTPLQTGVTLAVGGNLPSESVSVSFYYTTANNDIYSIPPGGPVTLATNGTCPTSGSCSISVASPPSKTNAAGYDVFARVGNGTAYRQNTNGPIPIVVGSSFTFGTTTNPLQTSGFALPTGTWASATGNVVGVDTVNNTITTDTAHTTLPVLANNPNLIIIRQLAGVTADTGTNASTVVCNSCNFTWGPPNSSDNGGQANGVPKWSVVYCGVTTGDAGAPLYSHAPQRGSEISSLTANVINLATPINCAPGTNFEIRKPWNLPFPPLIFLWSNSPYDAWKRFGNYMGADMILWFVTPPASLGGQGASSPCCQNSSLVSRRRENSLALLACHRAINIFDDLAKLGATTALQPTVVSTCTSPTAANNRWQGLFSMIDGMTNNNYGRGAHIGSFLDGLVGYALLDWWNDPLMNAQGNPQFLYWVKRLADNLWSYYELKNSYLTTCGPHYPHEWAYEPEDAIVGACTTSNGNYTILNPDGTTNPVNDYWSIAGNILPMYAFFYWYTGNGTITPPTAPPPWPSCCTSNPAPTYGAAYIDMASWIFVHMASTSSFFAAAPGAKTLGEMGIWQDQAIAWMRGTSGAPPPTQQYPSFKPPIISELQNKEPLFMANRSN